MDKKLLALGFVILLAMSGFVSAYANCDYKYQYGTSPKKINVIYSKPHPRAYHYQIGTFADNYGGFKVQDYRIISQKPANLNCGSSRQLQNYLTYDGVYPRQMCIRK